MDAGYVVSKLWRLGESCSESFMRMKLLMISASAFFKRAKVSDIQIESRRYFLRLMSISTQVWYFIHKRMHFLLRRPETHVISCKSMDKRVPSSRIR